MTSSRSLHCPNCGAALSPSAEKCSYCGAVILRSGSDVGKGRETADFGFSNPWYLVIILAGTAALYSWGWLNEDTEYWLADRAVIIWSLPLPLWVIISTCLWRTRFGSLGFAFITGIAVSVAHFIIILAHRNFRVNDDYAGIAAIFGGIVIAAWLTGRGLHRFIRAWLNRDKSVIHQV